MNAYRICNGCKRPVPYKEAIYVITRVQGSETEERATFCESCLWKAIG